MGDARVFQTYIEVYIAEIIGKGIITRENAAEWENRIDFLMEALRGLQQEARLMFYSGEEKM